MVAGRDPAVEAAGAPTVPRWRPPTPVTSSTPRHHWPTEGVVRLTGGHLWPRGRCRISTASSRARKAASDVGWVVGHSYIVYAPLFHGCTSVLFEGKPVGTPDAGTFWRVIADHQVSVMFTAPTAIRAIKKEDPDGALLARHDLAHFRAQFLAGERCDPDTLAWCETHLKVPAVDHWWQTESGWPIVSNCLGLLFADQTGARLGRSGDQRRGPARGGR